MSAFTNSVFAFLLAALWQSTAIVLLVWLVLKCLPRVNATTRYAMWFAALIASIVLPAVTSHVPATPSPPAISTPATSIAPQADFRPTNASRSAVEPAPSRVGVPTLHLNVFPAIASAVAFAWIGAAAFLLIRLATSLSYLERLKRNALPVAPEVRAGLRRWNAAPKGDRDVRLCVSDAIGVPVAIGLFDSMILLPPDFLSLDSAELDCVLLHELAHLRRGDDWTNAFQRVASALLFFSPAIVFASARLDVEREVACDDQVLDVEKDPLIYANCLARITRLAAWPRTDVAAPGIFTTRRGTSVRIERLLDGTRNTGVRISPVPFAAAVLTFCLVLDAAVFAAPALTFAVPIGNAIMDAPIPSANPRIAFSGDWDIKAWKQSRQTADELRNGRFSWAPVPADLATSERDVNLSLHYPISSSTNSVQTSLADLGIDAASLQGPEHPVHFTARFAAGTFLCDGAAANGLAKGTFSFTPDKTYVQTLSSLRGTAPTPREEVLSGLFDLQLPYIEALGAAGLRNLSFRDLVSLKMFGATPEEVKSIRDDFPTADVNMIAAIRMFKWNPADLHALHVLFPAQSLDMIVALLSAGVTPGYVTSLQKADVRELTADNVAALKASGVTQSFADHLATDGPHGLTIDEVAHLAKQSSPQASP